MSTSSHSNNDFDDFQSSLAQILGRRVSRLERVGGGKNSQVYHITCGTEDDERDYAVKRYYRHSDDRRDRLGVEYGALRFLSSNGISCVPTTVAIDAERGFAVYEYIRGTKKDAAQVTLQDIDDAVCFLRDLDELKSKKEATQFAPASEANFSIQDIIAHLQNRLDRMRIINETSEIHLALKSFLTNDIEPALRDIIDWCREKAVKSGIPFDEDIPMEKRTLSPSDFGFHNALWRSGRIVFLDFEYFGWDDPAKMIVDFLLHPAFPMQISAHLRNRYVRGLIDHFEKIHELIDRIQIVYPLFGMKWITIILNEFLPADLMRRQFAEPGYQDNDAIQKVQLEKARSMLARISKEYRDFPYLG